MFKNIFKKKNKMLADSEIVQYDSVLMEMVSKIVDTEPELFEDRERYWSHSFEQIQQFLERLPDEYKKDIMENKFEEDCSCVFASEISPYLKIGFQPDYRILKSNTDNKNSYTLDDCICCPLFFLSFEPKDNKTTKNIVQAALDQFFIYQEDLDVEGIVAVGFTDKNNAYKNLKFFKNILPKGTILEARSQYGFGNAEAKYIL